MEATTDNVFFDDIEFRPVEEGIETTAMSILEEAFDSIEFEF